MKKIITITLSLALAALLLAGCSGNDGVNNLKNDGVIDLTKMNSEMIYAEVNNMVTRPDEYLGRTYKISGLFDYSYFEGTGKDYYYCVIPDATSCCQQGIEFIWEGGHTTEEYPARQTEIILEGVYKSYEELGITYHYLSVENIITK